MAEFNIKDLEGNGLILATAPSDKIQKINTEILKSCVNKKGSSTVYVTIAKPYKTILNTLKKNNINTDNLFFIDCATSPITEGEEIKRVGNVIFCSPQLLTNLSIALTNALQGLPKSNKRILIFDTVSTLMLYNKAIIVTRFMHILTEKLRRWDIKSIIFILEEETDKKTMSQICQFCDKCVKIN